RTDSTEPRDVPGRLRGARRAVAHRLSTQLSQAITDPGVLTMKLHALALLVAAAVLPAAHAGVIDTANQQATQSWSAWGGTIGVRWNRDLLGNLGLTVADAPSGKLAKQDFRLHEWFDMRQNAGLQFTVNNASLRNFTGGSLQMRGGFVLKLRDGSTVDLRDLTLRARTDGSNILDLVSGDGKAWFYSDSLMFRLSNNEHGLDIVSANLRMSQALANRIG